MDYKNDLTVYKTQRPKLKVAIVTLFFLVLFVVVFLFIQNSRFIIKGVSPNTQEVTNYTPSIIVSLSKEPTIESTLAGLSASDPSILQRPSVSGKNIEIHLSTISLVAGTEYTISLKNISSTNGQVLNDYNFVFIPKTVPFDQLTKQQQQALIDDVDRDLENLDNVFLALPYIDRERNYYIDASEGPDGSISVVVSALVGTKPVSAQTVEEAKSYLVSKGVNLDDYELIVR